MLPLDELTRSYRPIDLSHRIEERMPSYPTHSRFFRTLWESYWHGERAVAYQLLLNEHTGTHVDAPAHFMRDGHEQHRWIDEVDPTLLLGRGVVIHIADGDVDDGLYGIDVLERFEREHGAVRRGDVVLFDTGWHRKWALKPDSDAYLVGWPGPTEELALALVERGISAAGSDNIGFDKHGTEGFPAHYALLGNGILIMENLAALSELPPSFQFLGMPLNIVGGSGSPIRAVAFVER
ncbi:cyclase family protein [Mycetocola reblochoni]|nr:cyclase family protein [Mycetocola reblochoni]